MSYQFPKWTIYAIKCEKNGRVYVGRSTKVDLRWKAHINALRSNTHVIRLMQEDFNKYGESNFSFEILDEVDFKDRKIEKEYMKEYGSYNPNFGYNYLDNYFGNKWNREERIRDISCFYGVPESSL